MAKIIFKKNRLIGSYQNGNYKTEIYEDGTRIRETEEDKFIPAFAENCDIKITDSCNMNCAFCHEGSSSNGKHGDILNPKFLKTFHPYQELACLDGETVCFGLDGAVKMKDLKIGDKIFDNEHKLRKIINIQKTEKENICNANTLWDLWARSGFFFKVSTSSKPMYRSHYPSCQRWAR